MHSKKIKVIQGQAGWHRSAGVKQKWNTKFECQQQQGALAQPSPLGFTVWWGLGVFRQPEDCFLQKCWSWRELGSRWQPKAGLHGLRAFWASGRRQQHLLPAAGMLPVYSYNSHHGLGRNELQGQDWKLDSCVCLWHKGWSSPWNRKTLLSVKIGLSCF